MRLALIGIARPEERSWQFGPAQAGCRFPGKTFQPLHARIEPLFKTGPPPPFGS